MVYKNILYQRSPQENHLRALRVLGGRFGQLGKSTRFHHRVHRGRRGTFFSLSRQATKKCKFQINTNNGDGDLADAGDNVRYYTTDANNNVTVVIDAATGNVVNRYDYTPYGETTQYDGGWSNPTTPGDGPLYCGYFFDAETANYCVRNRYYSSMLGLFVSRDPIGYKAQDMNLYRFVGNDPTNNTDPSGYYEGVTWCQLPGMPGPNGSPAGKPGINIRIDPNLPTCTKVCTLLHEGVHLNDQMPCCTKALDAFTHATPRQQEIIMGLYNAWIEANKAIVECLAYTVSQVCEKAAGDENMANANENRANEACAAAAGKQYTDCPDFNF